MMAFPVQLEIASSHARLCGVTADNRAVEFQLADVVSVTR